MHGARPLRSTRRLANLAGQRPGWYSITNSAAGTGPALVSIYDEIGFFGVSAGDFLADLRGIAGDIELHLNSPGGDVFDGVAIYNTLRQRAGTVRVIIDGLAASAASFIAQAASPGQLEIAPHAQMMIHDGFAMGIGNAGDMRDLADQLDRVSNEIASIYAERTGKPAEHWRSLMQAETWLTDKETVAAGLADKIHGQEAPAAEWDLSIFARYAPQEPAPVPAVANTASAPQAAQGQPEKLGDDGWVRDPDGRERFDPDGDGDDDSTPEGDTDHDYFDENGKQVKPVPPKPGAAANRAPAAFPALAASVDSTPWDASKAWHNGAASDDPAAFYRGICAGRKAGDPATQDAWALPYKYHPGDAPNAGGVRAALSRLPQTDGLTNAGEARATLERAMKAVNPDYDPDDHIDTELLAAVFSLGLEGANR